jgi:cytochrome c-type biogenesis protein CcmH
VSARSSLAALLAAGALLAGSSAPAAATPTGSLLPSLERQVMCVTCKIPLNLAASPQADRERAFIRSLIAAGRSEAQIKRDLVGQYGATVLALPSARGFDITAYVVPPAALLAVLAVLALLVRRWRRHGEAELAAQPPPAPLSPTQAARLDADLARFD